MPSTTTFAEVLDAIEQLPAEQQADLIEVVRRRLAERGRQQIADDTQSARANFAAGRIFPTTVGDLIHEIDS